MSIRSVIARSTGKDTFEGRSVHFDGYPSGVGQQLWHLYTHTFDHNLDRMLTVLLDDHPAGWSYISGDWTQPIGYSADLKGAGPACYCHGDRSEPAQLVRERDAASMGLTYAYVFDTTTAEHPTMRILHAQGRDHTGVARWIDVATVNLAGAEPDWAAIEASVR